MLFGEFLIKKGKLGREDIERVLQLQKKGTVPLGKLAVERNILSLADIFTIRSHQRKDNTRFGELAVKLNLLKPRQVDALLELQRELRPYFGELLMTSKLLTEAELLELLNEFKEKYGRISGSRMRKLGLIGLGPALTMEIRNALSKAGYEVFSSHPDGDGLAALLNIEPDFLVIGISGSFPGLLPELKRHRVENPAFHARILALADRLDGVQREDAAASGITDIVPASSPPESLAEYILNQMESLGRDEAGKVVLIDDSPTVLRLTSLFLEQDGYESYLASGGEEGLELVAKVEPDLVLMDLHMPGIDGIEACRRIKTDPKTRNIPVVMVTTAKSITRLKEALDSGAGDYILKPFQQEELLARVRSHIKTKRLIDEIQRSRKDLLTANEKLAEANRRKTDFLLTVSHDLRTPLTSIRTYAELMTMPRVTPETQKEYVGVITGETLRMTSLIRNYLDVARLESGAAASRRDKVNLSEMAAYFAKIYGTMARKKGVAFKTAFPENAVWFTGDKEHFEQALANLLDNAVKFTPAGGVITLGLKIPPKHPGRAELTVTDTGPGIPPEAKPFLFKKFHHLPGEDRAAKGTGLGLAICREIVEWHGGTIDFDSTPGKGTTFRVAVPVAAGGKTR